MKVYSIGEAARLCGVASCVVSKWYDSGRLKGYRVPGSQDRRIPHEYLVKFLRSHSMPLTGIESIPEIKAQLMLWLSLLALQKYDPESYSQCTDATVEQLRSKIDEVILQDAECRKIYAEILLASDTGYLTTCYTRYHAAAATLALVNTPIETPSP